MGFWDWILLAIAVVVGFALFQVYHAMKKRDQMQTKIDALPDFEATHQMLGEDGNTGLAVDTVRRKICLVENVDGNVHLDLLSYRDLLSVEIDVDGNTVTKTSRSSQVGGALIGGLLFGTAGAVVGGLSGKQISEERVDRIDLKLMVNRTKNPIHEVNMLNLETTPKSSEYRTTMNTAEKWQGLIEIMIREADREDMELERARRVETERIAGRMSPTPELGSGTSRGSG